jgi:hypothetical protein
MDEDDEGTELYCPICDLTFFAEPGESESDAYLRHGPECGMP